MLGYAVRRVVWILPVLAVFVTLVFFLVRLAPGGPFDSEKGMSPEVRANLEAAYGLDRPLAQQYCTYVASLLHGDFGPSFRFKDHSVTELIAAGLPNSLQLGSINTVRREQAAPPAAPTTK